MPYYKVKDVLSSAIKVINLHGFSTSKSSSNPTWKLTYDYMKECNFENIQIEKESLYIIDWVKSLNNKSCSSVYMSNVKKIIERGYVGRGLFGLIVNIIPIYRERKRKSSH